MTDSSYRAGSFTNSTRSLEFEQDITLNSVGVDIGSSTSHLVFSRLVLEQVGHRYVVRERHILYESDVLLTPYSGDNTIDAIALGQFIQQQYKDAKILPSDIDTGALILTGVAVRRSNARAIAELFADAAGKFVAVSAGDGLETQLVAFGSGAVARSSESQQVVMNVDLGGGTAKIALCRNGQLISLTAIDVGARIVCLDAQQRITFLEPAGERFLDELGLSLQVGDLLPDDALAALVGRMALRLFEAMGAAPMSQATAALLRLDPLECDFAPDVISFSGGVSEYIYYPETPFFGDLGRALAIAVLSHLKLWGVPLVSPRAGLRATVVGASQYAIQVSGNTIFVHPDDVLPLRNVPVVVPTIDFSEALTAEHTAAAIVRSLQRLDLAEAASAVTICYQWDGMASYTRLDAFCRGVQVGLAKHLSAGFPIILVGDGDIGGLLGLHLRETLNILQGVVSIDGVRLQEFDYIDIGRLLETTGSVPVVIKSLVFPQTRALGRVGADTF